MRILSSGTTDRGLKRESNEDSFLVDEELGLYLVCDGLGGHASGEVASRETARAVASHVRSRRDRLEHAGDAPGGHFRLLEIVEGAVQEACQHVFDLACSDSRHAGMATTLTLALVIDNKCILAHVGDCRLYMLRGDRVHQLSSDHTMANEMVHQGKLDPATADRSRWSHVLTRSVGSQASVHVDTLLFDLFPGDTCLLCSDGLSAYFRRDEEIVGFLSSERIEGIPQQLVDHAHAGGAHDNVTAVVFRAEAESESESDATEGMERELASLRGSPVFAKLSLGQLLRVRSGAELRRFDAGETIVAAGQPIDSLHRIVDGRVAVTPEGGRASELGPGEGFAGRALVREATARAQVKAVTPCTLLVVSRETFRTIVRRRPRLGRRLQANLLTTLCADLDGSTTTPGLDGCF